MSLDPLAQLVGGSQCRRAAALETAYQRAVPHGALAKRRGSYADLMSGLLDFAEKGFAVGHSALIFGVTFPIVKSQKKSRGTEIDT